MNGTPARTEREGSRRAELWVRSFSPIGIERANRDVLERLDSLVAAGVLDGYDVRTWAKEVGLSTTAARAERSKLVLDRVAAFREWADGRDRTLAPYFDTRETGSAITGESYTAQTLPGRALAEFEGEDLVYVAPSAAEDGTTTCEVEDRLDELLAGATARPAAGGR